MAYNYIGLVNDVAARLNEVPLSESNFLTALGVYSQIKESINATLRDINQDSFEWPFNHVTAEDTLTTHQIRYSYPSDAKHINFDSFRVKYRDQLHPLSIMDYEEFLSQRVDSELNPVKYAGRPSYIFRTPDFQFGVYPPPSDECELIYEYYRIPVDLILPTDVPYVPEQFRHIITDGAMHHAYMFRGDPESSAVMLQKFDKGIRNMRKIYQNRYEYVRGGYLPKNTSHGVRVSR